MAGAERSKLEFPSSAFTPTRQSLFLQQTFDQVDTETSQLLSALKLLLHITSPRFPRVPNWLLIAYLDHYHTSGEGAPTDDPSETTAMLA
jgi:hypothetical protein